MTSRERVLKALNFERTDRVPMDLGGMPSTCISCFAYPDLVRVLGLPPRRPRVYDTGQMLALPEPDVLDALGCDVLTITTTYTNAYPQPELWHPYDFNGRLEAEVMDPTMFEALEDGTIVQPRHKLKMPPQAHVFEQEHGGQRVVLDGDLPKPDLALLKAEMERWRVRDEDVERMIPMFQRARQESDRAFMFCGPQAGIGIGNFGGVATFPMLCYLEPDFVHELHDLVVTASIRNAVTLLEGVGRYIDVYQCCSDDWGTQYDTFASPEVYRQMFKPYYQRFTTAIHRAAPNVKTFLHSCGAIYDLIDDIVESGFDVLNPVQWPAGGHTFQEWKDQARHRIALWGGGVNAQETLPLGSVKDVEREVADVVSYMKQDGGYVFCGIHNILAEVPGEKVAAMYRTAIAR